MHRYSRLLAITVCIACFLASGAPSLLAQERLTGDQIQEAIKNGRGALMKLQAADGSWDPPGSQFGTDGKSPTHTWGGYTALATYALLASGSGYQDDPIKHGVDWLKKCDMHSVYCLGLRMQVWLLMWQQTGDAQYRDHANADATKLLDYLKKNDTGKDGTGQPYVSNGLWDYLGEGNRIDHSVSQYGVLGLWAAAQMGAEIPDKVWKELDDRWRADQFDDGAWAYSGTPKHPVVNDTGKPSMTAAGIATLFITQEYTSGNRGLACNGDVTNDKIETGLDHMSSIFDQVNDGYTFYGIERIGVASGYKYFGKVDWFSSIAQRIVQSQAPGGIFGIGGFPGADPVTSTSFCLLFLARGGAPVMMNKLDYSSGKGHGMHDAHWNERPRDAFNLARWTGIEAEADNLNWQVVNLQAAAEDLHDAPILYISGNQPLKLPPADENMLRQFVEQGGMILGDADCGSEAFARSFEKLGEKLFPKYEFKDLGKGDLIYTGETYTQKKMRGFQQIRALDNGVRKVMLLFASGDPARRWQSNSTKTDPAAFMIGADVFLYATDVAGLRNKADSFVVRPDSTSPKSSIKVARLMVGNNPDPEPGGWPRLSAILHNAPYSLGVTVTPVKSGDVLAGDYQVVHLTGTTAFKLDPAEQTILQDFVNKGGTLIIDAAGGNGAFADSAEAALLKMFPNEAAKGLARALPLTDPIYNIPNAQITEVKYRRFARRSMTGSPKVPHIRGITIGKRIGIYFSREDLSAGLVGEQVDGINGYDPASATAIMRNMILYAANPSAVPANPAPIAPKKPASS